MAEIGPRQAPRPWFQGSICRALARLTLGDSVWILISPDFWKLIKHYSLQSHFFLLWPWHISFLDHCKYLNVAIRRHSSAPLAGLVTKCRAWGAAIHAGGIHANYRSRRR
jgi:hypothetical protein